MKLHTPIIMPDHITYASGKIKTVCVTACLTAIGIPFHKIRVTGNVVKRQYLRILSNNGFSIASRKSKMPKTPTLKECSRVIRTLDEDALYFVVLMEPKYCHAVLLDSDGLVQIDTDSRDTGNRIVHTIHAVTRAL